MAIFNVKDFGAVGNGIDDDSPAFQRALDALDSVFHPSAALGGGGVLFIPAGLYNLTKTLFVKTGTVIQGCGSESTHLCFVSPESSNTTIAGIVLNHSFSSVRDIGIITNKALGYNPNVPNPLVPPEISDDETNLPDGISHSGITIRADNCSVENCFVNGFEHDGIHVQQRADLPVPPTADCWQVRGCLVQQNGRHGLFVTGGVGGGCAMRVECAENRKVGFYDRAQTGNTYIACLAQSNGVFGQFGGGYHMFNGHHILLGCVEDQDQFGTIGSPAVVIGGLIGQASRDGRSGAPYPLKIEGFAFPAVLYLTGDFSAPGVRSNGVHPANRSVSIQDGRTTTILADSHSLPENESRLEISLPDTTVPNSGVNLQGYQLTVKKVDASKIPVVIPPSPQTGQKIDGNSEVSLIEHHSWVTVLWGLDTWHIIGRG